MSDNRSLGFMDTIFRSNDKCPCCGLPRTTLDVKQYDCTLDDLRKAADDSCMRCKFYLDCIEVVEPRDLIHSRIIISAGYFRCLVGERSTNYFGIQERPNLPGSTSSEDSFKTAKSWIEDCVANHPDCIHKTTAISTDFQYPKRLLRIMENKVCIMENVQDRPRYACLSYCWGPATEVVKTTYENDKLSRFKIEIPWNELTKTVQDAIDACRRIGIDYIWIDSLCIVQDSDDDWREESAKMADIYENAFLTIAATRSKQSSMGCYATTDSKYLSRHIPGHNVYVQHETPRFPQHWTDRRETDIWPIFSRGWIYQEMRLSHRILHFCTQELMWECRSVIKNERTHSDEDLVNSNRRLGVTMYSYIPYIKLAQNPRKLWWRTVQEYSRLSFSFERDKLPALGALTQRMENMRITDRYLAGLWEKTLLLDLCWMVWPTPNQGIIRSPVWRAPTWSWASLSTQVMWESAVDDVLDSIEVVDIKYASIGPTHMGKISEARITLRAPLIETSLQELNRSQKLQKLPRVTRRDTKFDYDIKFAGPSLVPTNAEVFLLPIGVCKLNSHHEALALHKVPGASVYERFGWIRLEHERITEVNEGRYQALSRNVQTNWEKRAQEDKLIEEMMMEMDRLLMALPHVDVILV